MKIRMTPMRWMGRSPWDMMEEIDWPKVSMGDGLDVFEEDEFVVVKAAVPGIQAEKVEVTYEDGVLRIFARHEESEEEKARKKVVYRLDRSTSFEYSTTFPRPIDANSITASVEHGVVIVKARIAEEAKAKKISVSTT